MYCTTWHDYFIVGPPYSTEYASNINIMATTCKELGFAVNPKRATQSSPMTNILRIDTELVKHHGCLDSEQRHHRQTQGHFQGKISHQAHYPLPCWETSLCLPYLQNRQGLLSLLDREIHESCITSPQDQT